MAYHSPFFCTSTLASSLRQASRDVGDATIDESKRNETNGEKVERGMGDCKSEEHFKTASLIAGVAIVLLEKKVYRCI